MLKFKHVYICDVCGKMGKLVIHLPIGAFWLPDNWGTFGKMDLCDKCYAKIKRLFEDAEDASNT